MAESNPEKESEEVTSYDCGKIQVSQEEIIGKEEEQQQKSCCRTEESGRKFRSLTFCRRYKSKSKEVKKRKGPWSFKLNCCRLRKSLDSVDIPEQTAAKSACVCTGYRRTEEHNLGATGTLDSNPQRSSVARFGRDYPRFNCSDEENKSAVTIAKETKDYPTEDCDERARAERAREIEEGIEPPPGYLPASQEIYGTNNFQISILASVLHDRLSLNFVPRPTVAVESVGDNIERDPFEAPYLQRMVHTQVDYIHCLVPDLLAMANCPFYWGKMDRYEAERLLKNKPEGTFLLRDSAQEEHLFSVSFRRYGRSMHARIEQWNHRFSFDSHDPAVFSSETVFGLIEHYKDPNSCMFFEPMLIIPLNRNNTFTLQHLCRATVCNNTTYDGINRLHLPKTLKTYLKEYHYKQRVRVRRYDMEL